MARGSAFWPEEEDCIQPEGRLAYTVQETARIPSLLNSVLLRKFPKEGEKELACCVGAVLGIEIRPFGNMSTLQSPNEKKKKESRAH